MTEAANLKDESKNEPMVQASGDGARRGSQGIRNLAGEKSPSGETGRYKRGQNVTCRVGLCEYEDGYSVTVLETGDFGILRTSTKLLPNDEIQAVFDCLSPVGSYNQYYTCPILGLTPPSQKGANLSVFSTLTKIISAVANQKIGPRHQKRGQKQPLSIGTCFQFVDGTDLDYGTGSLSADSKKPWSEIDKQTITALLEKLNRDAPGLMHLATIGGPIELIRVEKIVEASGRCFPAVAGQRKIKFADRFFSMSDQFRGIVHEITHVADCESHFAAYSREWVQLAEPLITEFRSLKSDADKDIFLRTKWPSAYACENLQEALAEYVASYASNQYFESKEQFEQTVLPLILEPEPKVIQWKHFVSDVTDARNKTDLKSAGKRLKKTAKLFPNKPYSHLHLAGIAATLGDLETTILHTKRMISAFELTGSSLNIERESIQLLLKTFNGSRNRDGANAFVDWVLSVYPADPELSRYKMS